MAWVEKRVGRDHKTPSYRVRWRDPAGQLRSVTVTQAEGGRARADQLARAIQVDVDRGEYLDPEGPRTALADWAGEWVAHRVVRASTAAAQDSRLRQHVLPAFGALPLGKLQRMAVQGWVKDLSRQGLAADTVRSCYTLLSQILEAAVDEGLLASSPCRKIQLPAPDAREPRVLEVGEAGRLLTNLGGTSRTLVVVLLGTGLRWGEMAGLKRGRLKLLGRPPTLTVDEALHEVSGRLYFEPPKTRTSRRVVPLPAAVVDALAAHLPAGGDPAEVVFHSPKGALLRSSNFRDDVWLPAIERARLDGLHPHDLRHTYATWLASAGVPEHVRRAVMGHAGAGGAHGRYVHLVPEDARRVVEVMDGCLSRLGAIGSTQSHDPAAPCTNTAAPRAQRAISAHPGQAG